MTDDQGDDQEPKKKIPALLPEETEALERPKGDGDTGQQEAKILSLGLSQADIKKNADAKEHIRDQYFKDHFERLAVVALYTAFIGFLAVGGTWFWHLLTPWSFLTPEQVATVQNIATGGILATVATGHVKKRVG